MFDETPYFINKININGMYIVKCRQMMAKAASWWKSSKRTLVSGFRGA